MQIGDPEIRGALRTGFQRFGVRVVEEWNVGACRIDMATISRTALHGIEIKSAQDSLSRFERQVRDYSRTFCLCTLVAPSQHVEAAERNGLLPPWWGVILIDPLAYGSGFTICRFRAAEANPSPDVMSLAWLLWRREMVLLAGEIGVPRAYRLGKAALVRTIAQRMTREALLPRATEYMLARSFWTRWKEEPVA